MSKRKADAVIDTTETKRARTVNVDDVVERLFSPKFHVSLRNIVIAYLHGTWTDHESTLRVESRADVDWTLVAWTIVLIPSERAWALMQDVCALYQFRSVDKLEQALTPFRELLPVPFRRLQALRAEMKTVTAGGVQLTMIPRPDKVYDRLHGDHQLVPPGLLPRIEAPSKYPVQTGASLSVCTRYGRALVEVCGQSWNITTAMMLVLHRMDNYRGPHLLHRFDKAAWPHIFALVKAGVLHVKPTPSDTTMLSPLQTLWISEPRQSQATPARRLMPDTTFKNPLKFGHVFAAIQTMNCLIGSYSPISRLQVTRAVQGKFKCKSDLAFVDVDGMIDALIALGGATQDSLTGMLHAEGCGCCQCSRKV